MVSVKIKYNLRLDKESERKNNYKFDNKLPKQFLKNYKNYKIYIVDGNYIRNNIDIDFVGGGNPSRYQYVPKGELWVEKLSDGNKNDIDAFIEHEYVECERMKNKGESYDVAHEKASEVEKIIRNKNK